MLQAYSDRFDKVEVCIVTFMQFNHFLVKLAVLSHVLKKEERKIDKFLYIHVRVKVLMVERPNLGQSFVTRYTTNWNLTYL